MNHWLSIIGLGEDGLDALSPAARTLVDTAEIVVGGKRHLAMLPPDHPAERLTWKSPLRRTVADIRPMAGRRVTVLATGDPMSFGVGVTLAREFGMDAVTVIPAVGAFSLAAARLGWPLAGCDCLTLHGRPLELLNLHIRPGGRLLILSENGDTPAQIAAVLRQRGYGPSRITVLAHMGGRDEARRDGTADHWDEARAADLNTVAVDCIAGPDAVILPRLAGLPDEVFVHDGQMTKREVRAVSLAALAPQPGALLWDAGAGAGSVAIEWMRAGGRAVAVERQAARCALIARNAATLGVPTLDIVTGAAPAALHGLPPPEAIFIGGGITEPGLAEACWDALSANGRLVANVVTLEGEARVAELHERWGGTLTRIAVSRAEAVGPYRGWKPAMPVTMFAATKPSANSHQLSV